MLITFAIWEYFNIFATFDDVFCIPTLVSDILKHGSTGLLAAINEFMTLMATADACTDFSIEVFTGLQEMF
jgi:hypothetical protein